MTYRNLALFWVLVLISASALIFPLWVGPIPPLPEFAAHAANAAVWTGIDQVEFYERMFVLREDLIPNTLSARFAAYLEPSMSTIAALRLYLSVAVAGSMAGLIAVAHVFGRNKWMVFLTFPLVWTTVVYSGAVDLAAILPMGLFAAAMAKKAADSGSWGWGIGLAIVAFGSSFIHPAGPPVCVGVGAVILGVFARDPAARWQILGLVPAVVGWVYWIGRAGASLSDIGYLDPLVRIEELMTQGIDVSWLSVGSGLLVLLGLLFAAWVSVSDAAEDEWKRLPWLYLGLCTVFMFLPATLQHVAIALPIGSVLLILIVLYPRRAEGHRATPYLVGIAVLASVGVGLYLANRAEHFHQRNLRPLATIAQDIEPGSRIDCYAVRHEETAFHGPVLRHHCPGFLQAKTLGFGGTDRFKHTLNPVGFAGDYTYKPIDDHGLADIGHLQIWDYVVTDGPRAKPPKELASLVSTAKGVGSDAPEWHLYRVTSFERDWTTHRVSQASGGAAFTWSCPEGWALAGYQGRRTSGGDLSTLEPICREIRPGVVPGRGAYSSRPRPDLPAVPDPTRILTPEPMVDHPNPVMPPTLAGEKMKGPLIGHLTGKEEQFRTICPPNKFVVGMEGLRRGLVRDIAVRCAKVETTLDRMTGRTLFTWIPSESEVIGTVPDDGTRFSFTCQPDSVVTGAVGRNGFQIDAAGIGCERTDTLTEMP